VVDPRELQAGDIVEIHTEALSDVLWRVSDTEVEDIGITETFAVTLVSDADGDSRAYSIVGTTADSTATIAAVEGDLSAESTDSGENSSGDESDTDEHMVNWNDIQLQ